MADGDGIGRGQHKNSKQALIDGGKATRFQRGESAANAARAAAKAKSENCKRTKTMREAVKVLLDLATTDEQRAALRAMGLEPSNRNAATFAMVEKALNGSEKAYEVLRDTAGEQPKLKVGLSAEDAMTADDLRKLSDAELAALVDGGSNDV